MSWPSGYGGTRIDNVGVDLATSLIPTVTCSATANVKGSWAELSSSLPFDADGFHLTVVPRNGNFDALLDIGIGAAGSEVVILSNVLFSSPNVVVLDSDLHCYVPIPIKTGTRVAARFQSTLASQDIRVAFAPVAGDFYSALRAGRATTYGANTADSGGTAVDPGTTAHTKGSWAEIVSALTNPMRSCLVCIGSDPASDRDNMDTLFDLGVGAAASEKVILPNEYHHSNTTGDTFIPVWRVRYVGAKAGERLAARGQCNVTSADRIFDLAVVGFD